MQPQKIKKIIETKKISTERKVILAEGILLVGILIYLAFATAPAAVSPIAGQTISEPDLIFEIKNGGEIIISTDEDFTNPIILREGEEIDLPPGTYYWKVKGLLRTSKVQSFTIESNVGLDLREGEEKDRLENSGNVGADVEKKKGIITTDIDLNIGESIEVEKDDSDYTGEQE